MGELQQIDAAPPVAKRPRGNVAARKDDGAILSLIERAARDPSVDIDKMERLVAMQERMVAQRASAAFSAAFADMQTELPSIAENGLMEVKKDNRLIHSSKYALWEDINDAIKPVLAKHGFGLRFEVGRSGERINVTGVLMHREGHSERTMMELPADTSGSKNAVQAIGSSTSYGKRYVACALLNITSRMKQDRDDDGASALTGQTFPGVVTDAQAENLREALTKAGGNIDRFIKYFKVECIPDLPSSRFDEAMRMIKAKGGR